MIHIILVAMTMSTWQEQLVNTFTELPKSVRDDLITSSVKFVPVSQTNGVNALMMHHIDNITVDTFTQMIESVESAAHGNSKLKTETLILLNMLRDDPSPDLMMQLNTFDRLEFTYNGIVMLRITMNKSLGYMCQIDLSTILSRVNRRAAEIQANRVTTSITAGLTFIGVLSMYLFLKY